MDVDESGHGGSVSASVFEIEGQRYEPGTPGFAEAIAAAHAGHGAQSAHHRPRCLCRPGPDGRGIEMYVARLAGAHEAYLVKRMPNTGPLHAPDCPSYEPPPELSGLGQVLGSAISEDPATGETTLKLDFALSKSAGRSRMPPAGGISDSVASDGTRLSLRGLLHYLWDQAELTRWQPGFAGRRSWGTVRRHLLQAAQQKVARGESLASRLYVPEVFSVEQREAINARRLAQWASSVATPGKPQSLLLMVAELKEVVPARYGHKALVKHVPDQAFAVDEALYRRLGRAFESVLALWGATDSLHMVMIATVGVNATGLPGLVELSLMPVTAQWLPVEDAFELQLIARLVREGRSFVKGLRYHLPAGGLLASAVLTDVGEQPVGLTIARRGGDDSGMATGMDGALDGRAAYDTSAWVWQTSAGVMPPLPPKVRAPMAVSV